MIDGIDQEPSVILPRDGARSLVLRCGISDDPGRSSAQKGAITANQPPLSPMLTWQLVVQDGSEMKIAVSRSAHMAFLVTGGGFNREFFHSDADVQPSSEGKRRQQAPPFTLDGPMQWGLLGGPGVRKINRRL